MRWLAAPIRIHRSAWKGYSQMLRQVSQPLILPFVDQRGGANPLVVSHPPGWGAQVSQDTSDRSFDELTRGLASGRITRGKAIRLMGAALLGGTLGSLGFGGVAGADPP